MSNTINKMENTGNITSAEAFKILTAHIPPPIYTVRSRSPFSTSKSHDSSHNKKSTKKLKESWKPAVLPETALDKLDSIGFTDKQKSKAIKVLMTIIRECRKDKTDFTRYNPFPATFWKKHVGAHYERVLSPLIEAKIINYTGYHKQAHQCREYRINPEMMNGILMPTKYLRRKLPSSPITNSPECRHTKRILRKMAIDVRAAKASVDDYISSGDYQLKIEVNPDLPDSEIIHVLNPDIVDLKKEYFTAKFFKKLANRAGYSLILDDNKYYIDEPQAFFKRKEQNIRLHYFDAIYRFQKRDFYARRNSTNSRLDSNLTSMPQLLLKHITIDGESLCSLDLSNSQFTIFASLIYKYLISPHAFSKLKYHSHNPQSSSKITHFLINKPWYTPITQNPYFYSHFHYYNQYINTYICAKMGGGNGYGKSYKPVLPKDVERFVKLAKSGGLYEFIRDQLKLGNGAAGRKKAKGMMFRIFFAKSGDSGYQKQQMKSLFPNVIEAIDAIKREHGENMFAVGLQREESRIFIDGILKKLIESGASALSKHDSILFPRSEYESIRAVMEDNLDEELLEYNLRKE